jgi:16S rRNA (guanine966-N2)-methyltransferase
VRIVAGKYRGRRLAAPEGRDLRPTADRTRESVFNILQSRLEGGMVGRTVLDVFAGTGAYGLEALSRGAAHATFIENAPASLAALKDNIRALGVHTETTVLQQDATGATAPPPVAGAPCAVVFVDPPYDQGLGVPALIRLAAQGWIADGATVVVEVARKEPFVPPQGFEAVAERTYGAARVVILLHTPA